MDRGIKILLSLIAANLIILNLQVADVSILPEANASNGPNSTKQGLDGIRRSIDSVSNEIQKLRLNN